jgi:hypothetical protein
MQTSNNRNFNYTLVLVGSPATNYAITYYCNDSLNNLGTSSVNFGVRTTPPIISLNYPANSRSYANSSVQFNYTTFASDGLDTCELWGNWSGAWEKNQSTTTISNGGENYFSVILDGGSYKWNVWCNNTIGQNDFSTQGNISFSLDRTAPNVSFISPISTVYNTVIRTISISSGSDANSVWYYNGTSNISYSGSTDVRLEDGSYTFVTYANDSAGNLNSSSVSFIVDSTSPISIVRQKKI